MSGFRVVGGVFALWLLTASVAVAVPHRSAVEAPSADVRLGSRDGYVLAFTGDTLAHPAVSFSAARHDGSGGYDFAPMFAEVSILLQAADLALCHLEVPLDPDSDEITDFPVFSAPAELAEALAGAGFDGCSTASNHVFDRGLDGAADTMAVLDAAGLGYAGTATGPEGRAGTLYDLGGLVVGHSSYAYGFQRHRVPDGQPWLANRIDENRIIADAAELRRRGSEFTVVSLHWGAEYSSRPTSRQQALADRLLSHPLVDLVVGHHAHVLQPIDAVAGKIVMYSLGNFISNQTGPCCPPESEEGAIVLVRIDRTDHGWSAGEVRHVPTWVNRRTGHIVMPALGDSAEGSRHRSRLRAAARRAAGTLGPLSDGLSVPGAYRWILASVPSRWRATAVERETTGAGDGNRPAAR
jgi:poly-gamma-glutamate synthesis protein (capsule biosynthesis protein)